eukprot:459976_1
MDQVFRVHFGIADTDFNVKLVIDPNVLGVGASRTHVLSSSDHQDIVSGTGIPLMDGDHNTANPFQTIELQRMIHSMKQLLELHRVSTARMAVPNMDDIDDDKQPECAEGNALLDHETHSSGVEFALLKKEVRRNQEELMRNQERNHEELLKLLQTK